MSNQCDINTIKKRKEKKCMMMISDQQIDQKCFSFIWVFNLRLYPICWRELLRELKRIKIDNNAYNRSFQDFIPKQRQINNSNTFSLRLF